MKSINEAMIQDHKIINNILNQFTEKLKTSNNHKDLLNDFFKFKWNLEKHFFIEEKIIISAYSEKTKNTYDNEIKPLLNEHKEMLDLLNEIQDSLEAKQKPQIDEFIDLLYSHEKNEDNYFYPKLDEELDTEHKKLILKRCNEIILG